MKNKLLHKALSAAKHLSEAILPLFFWILLIFGFDEPYMAILTILSALLHELGHIIAMMLVGRFRGKLRAHLSGFRITAVGGGYTDDIISLIGGPAINFLAFLFCSLLCKFKGGYIMEVAVVNLITALSNLLPVEGYDGYNILMKLLNLKEATWGIRLLWRVSFGISIAFTFFSLYLLLRYGEGYWVFGIFFSLLLGKIFKLSNQSFLEE